MTLDRAVPVSACEYFALLNAPGAISCGVLLLKSRVITTDEIVGLWGLLRGASPADTPVG